MASSTNSPISLKRLEQIASDACNSVFKDVTEYDHPLTGQWNKELIGKVLKSVTAEAVQEGTSNPAYKFAVNSTIVQHVPPPPSTGGNAKKAGRRGLHSSTGGFWNEKTDGMWSYKWDGAEEKGLDVIVMLIWVSV